MWGISYDKPARYMKEYLAALMPLLQGETVNVDRGADHHQRVRADRRARGRPHRRCWWRPWAAPCSSWPARVADGTITWMTGTRTIDSHIAPTIRAAAEAAGRPAPRIVVSLPVCVTADVDAARERVDQAFAIYPNLPSYKAMLDKEGADQPVRHRAPG